MVVVFGSTQPGSTEENSLFNVYICYNSIIFIYCQHWFPSCFCRGWLWLRNFKFLIKNWCLFFRELVSHLGNLRFSKFLILWHNSPLFTRVCIIIFFWKLQKGKTTIKAYFNQETGCTAPVYWSKYTTLFVLNFQILKPTKTRLKFQLLTVLVTLENFLKFIFVTKAYQWSINYLFFSTMFFASVLVIRRGPFSRVLCKYLSSNQIVQSSQPVEKKCYYNLRSWHSQIIHFLQ